MASLSITSGTDCWLLNGEMNFSAYEDDATVVSAMQEATKRIAGEYKEIIAEDIENTAG